MVDLEYRYSTTQNNGQITQMKDWVSGEEVSYQYDSLSRLISAVTTGPEWGQSYSYDGFGNRTLVTVTKGTAPSGNLTYDGMTNRITNSGFSYDANGNLTAMPGLSLSYDYDNRLGWTSTEGGYSYDPDNRRMFKSATSAEQVYFYGVDGRKLGTYQVNWDFTSIQMLSEDLYFAGRLIKSNGQWVVTDRLGSVVKSGGTETLRYFPWGEERNTTTQNRDKFGAYFRDSTGLDYALNRYYSSSHGRFLTPDPYYSSAGPEGPQSWNRYAYVENDPVNKVDPYGLDLFWADSLLMFPGELGGIGGWGWGLPSWMDIWGLPWWMPFPAPPVLPAPPASAPPSAAAGSSAEPSGGQSCASQTTAGPFQDPFAQVAAAGFQQGMTQVMTMPCPVPIPQVCAVTTLIRVTVYAAAAAALLLDAIQRRGQSDPYTLPRVNPGRDAAGNCNPCPPDGPPWQDPGDAHGSTGGSHWHWIKYNQNPTTCECYPTRMDSPTRP